MPNTEYDSLQQLHEYQHRKRQTWDCLLVVARCVALALLVFAIAQVAAEEQGIVRIGPGQAPPITLADGNPQYFATGPVESTSQGTVRITVRYRGPGVCPPPPPPAPALVRQEDGTYEKQSAFTIHALLPVVCWREATWQEEWTRLPEEGGVFLRRMTEEEKP